MARLRFLFTTLQYVESDFYRRVGEELERLGHEAVHVAYSRRAARSIRRHGGTAHCLPDVMSALGELDLEREAGRILASYETPSLRDVYRTDSACHGRSEEWSAVRTIRHFVAIERLIDSIGPDVIVPEVGSETMRTAAHLVGLRRNIPVLFLFYTIFPNPLRLYVDTMDAPIAQPEELRRLTEDEHREVEAFIADFKRSAAPIRPHRRLPLRLDQARRLLRHVVVRAIWDRDNEYLRPLRWLGAQFAEHLRVRAARALYRAPPGSRPFLYFPLHVVEDYKIARLLPHCADQAAIVELVAAALPDGYELVVKEHPMSIGRNRLGFLARLRRIPGVRLVPPRTSSHALVAESAGVVVISSTVGLEALLYEKPVLTIGRPFYSGLGVTIDTESQASLRPAVGALPGYRPDPERIRRFLHAAMRRCRPGAPVLVDRSDANAGVVARSLHSVALEQAAARHLGPIETGLPGAAQGHG